MALRVICAAAVITAAPSSQAAQRHLVLVSASPGLDLERLATALQIYVDGFDITVRTIPYHGEGDLREQLAANRQTGLRLDAVALVRIVAGPSSRIEIQLVDRVSDKSVISSLKRPPREQDLCRTLALKVQALLRSAWAEEPSQLRAMPGLARLAMPAAAPDAAPTQLAATGSRAAPPRAPSLEVAYALLAFPLDGLVQQGVSVSGTLPLGRRLEVGVGLQALDSLRAVRDDVTATVHTIPLDLRAGMRGSRGRLEGALSVVGQVLFAWADSSSTGATVRSQWAVEPALGLQAKVGVRLGHRFRFFLSSTTLGILAGKRFTVRGEKIMDLARLQTGAQLGLGIDLQ
jgi:hypothetical protein